MTPIVGFKSPNRLMTSDAIGQRVAPNLQSHYMKVEDEFASEDNMAYNNYTGATYGDPYANNSYAGGMDIVSNPDSFGMKPKSSDRLIIADCNPKSITRQMLMTCKVIRRRNANVSPVTSQSRR